SSEPQCSYSERKRKPWLAATSYGRESTDTSRRKPPRSLLKWGCRSRMPYECCWYALQPTRRCHSISTTAPVLGTRKYERFARGWSHATIWMLTPYGSHSAAFLREMFSYCLPRSQG